MTETEKRFPFIPFLINLVIPLIFAAVGSFFKLKSVIALLKVNGMSTGFLTINQIGLIRLFIFICIGIASFMVWRRRRSIVNYTRVLFFYFLQHAFNLLYPFLYFSGGNRPLGVVSAAVFLVLISVNAVTFYRIHKLAGLLLIPIFLWVLFTLYIIFTHHMV